jgi:hypothetical protein
MEEQALEENAAPEDHLLLEINKKSKQGKD